MFDIGFSEILLFGIIALIVLGPEKLPKAARTAGQWYAKARRTITTLQSEIEAEFDLAETRQQMQDEIAKIRQTEAEMRREMAEMRGSMREFEYSQNHSLRSQHEFEAAHPLDKNTHQKDAPNHAKPAEFSYAYASESLSPEKPSSNDLTTSSDDDSSLSGDSDDMTTQTKPPPITKPWENMWFRLGAYDKARRLPAAPFLPNYQPEPLLNAALNNQQAAE